MPEPELEDPELADELAAEAEAEPEPEPEEVVRSPLQGGPSDGVTVFEISGATAGEPLLLALSRTVADGEPGRFQLRKTPLEIGLAVVGGGPAGLAPTLAARDVTLALNAAPAARFFVLAAAAIPPGQEDVLRVAEPLVLAVHGRGRPVARAAAFQELFSAGGGPVASAMARLQAQRAALEADAKDSAAARRELRHVPQLVLATEASSERSMTHAKLFTHYHAPGLDLRRWALWAPNSASGDSRVDSCCWRGAPFWRCWVWWSGWLR